MKFNIATKCTTNSSSIKHVKNVHWIVCEDGNATNVPVKLLLHRLGISFTYLLSKDDYKRYLSTNEH